jgi:hypothetical protein
MGSSSGGWPSKHRKLFVNSESGPGCLRVLLEQGCGGRLGQGDAVGVGEEEDLPLAEHGPQVELEVDHVYLCGQLGDFLLALEEDDLVVLDEGVELLLVADHLAGLLPAVRKGQRLVQFERLRGTEEVAGVAQVDVGRLLGSVELEFGPGSQ